MANSDQVKKAAAGGVPRYVLDYAPLLHLSSKDPYKPSSIAAQLTNTRPQISFKDVSIPTPPLTLANLDQLNATGDGGNNVYLTSTIDVTTNPKWLEGVKLDGAGDTGEKTASIIVVDKGNGVTDVFYMYFWAFNWGGVVLENQLGDHVGDWEHNMIRFVNGIPKFAWFSQHANGEAFKFEVLKKDKSGMRPLVFIANGSHALFPTPGTHDHTIPNLNLDFPLLLVDECDAGPIYDPLLSSYYYHYNPSDSIFQPYNGTDPVGFLRYKGRWGDQEYPRNDKRQQDLVGNKKYVGGPTGPADKQLDRKDVWPQNKWSGGQRIRGSLNESLADTVKGWFGKLNPFGKKARAQRVLVSGERVK